MEPIQIFFLVFVLMMILRAPMYLCLLGSSLLYIFLTPQLSMLTAMNRMMNAPNSFTLLAVPFFILAGQVMNNGGVTDRIFGFAKKMIGHWRGGLAYVNVLSSLIFSGISGSALADVGGLGMIEIKAMRDENYDDDLTLGVTGASSTVGPIIPPSIPFVIYGAMANVSIGALFMAGMGPGIVLCLVLCGYIYIIAHKRNYPQHEKAGGKEKWKAFVEALPALMFPAIMLGGIWTGWFTPTESAMFSVVYGIFVSCFIYKELDLRKLPSLAVATVRQVGPSIAVVVGASLFAWVMTYEQIDKVVVQFVLSVTSNKYVILLMINIILLILGMFIEVVAAIMIMLPILTPLMAVANISPIHMGVILVLNMMIGLLTPPVGMSLYMLSSASKRSFGDVVKMVSPWLIPLFIALLMITYIEPITMFLPGLFGYL